MRVVSINTGRNAGDYVRRLPVLAGGVAGLKPDIVCMQEVFQAGREFDTAAEMGRVLAMPVTHVPARPKMRAVAGHGEMMSTSGLAVASRYPVAASSSVELPTSPADGGRLAQVVELTTPLGRIRVVNVHLSFLEPPSGDALRASQWEALQLWLDGSLPTLIAGDFNAAPDSPLIRQLLADRRFDFGPDELAKSAPTALGGLLGHEPRGAAVDHVVALRPGLSVASRAIALDAVDSRLGTAPSDHAAVVAEIRDGYQPTEHLEPRGRP